ncbi:hypothetical protein JCM21714_3902 [Gracilibacillus boraciitolerans JCM 21714]|uniref:Uncharacterized protein n=1 Tax=Gracilibacillus boraciitolerans JCM 21714 TaxID=1298598 RepID=W4VPE8_9BACI|nr:hypothetical protein [Gracilibacillus boraciitolerans]GAE94718.1 hypothetical protein JCM21714_3902 [Gracilibacillus boraciitolerans JCM 21714]
MDGQGITVIAPVAEKADPIMEAVAGIADIIHIADHIVTAKEAVTLEVANL